MNTRSAALPMYDLPELRAATDALWQALAQRLRERGLGDVPEHLTRDLALDDLWRDPGLLLAQTCGYPLVTALRDRVQLVATPRYLAQGCDGPFYRSGIVVRRQDPAATLADLRGRRCALNERSSNSGMNLLRGELAALAASRPVFSDVVITGSHLQSAAAVVDGVCDVAAIDAVVMALMTRHRPHIASRLRVLAWTAPSPGLPLITGIATPPATVAALRQALREVAGDDRLKDVRADLLLEGFDILSPSDYDCVADIERAAARRGYPELA